MDQWKLLQSRTHTQRSHSRQNHLQKKFRAADKTLDEGRAGKAAQLLERWPLHNPWASSSHLYQCSALIGVKTLPTHPHASYQLQAWHQNTHPGTRETQRSLFSEVKTELEPTRGARTDRVGIWQPAWHSAQNQKTLINAKELQGNQYRVHGPIHTLDSCIWSRTSWENHWRLFGLIHLIRSWQEKAISQLSKARRHRAAAAIGV